MKKIGNRNLKILFILFIVAFMVAFLYSDLMAKRREVKKVNIPKMDVEVRSDDAMLGATCGLNASYPMDFVRIKSISFATTKTDLFIKYQLGSKLPEVGKLPSYRNDKLTGVVFYLDLGSHYFDDMGNRNPSGLDINIKMSFYGNEAKQKNDGRLNISGQLVDGGPGYDYFVSRFPYRKLIFSQNSPYIVFGTTAVAVSNLHMGGASRYDFENKALAVPNTNNQDIKIKLEPKK